MTTTITPEQTPTPDRLLSTNQVAAHTGQNPTTITRWARQGKFPPPHTRDHSSHAYLWKETDVHKWIIWTDQLMTYQDIAKWCGVSHHLVRKWAKHHPMPPPDLITNNTPHWHWEKIEDWLDENNLVEWDE